MFFIAAGMVLYFWAAQHSPHMAMIELLSKADVASNAYYIGEPLYSLIVIFAGALGLHGFALTMRGLDGVAE